MAVRTSPSSQAHTLDPQYKFDILNLKCEYSQGVRFSKKRISIHSSESQTITGFIGSSNVVFLAADTTIEIEAPGCIAAPVISMCALQSIRLGSTGQGEEGVPMRLYAAEHLALTTAHVVVGDMEIVSAPMRGYIGCRKLTFVKSTEEDPPHFEIVRSWVMDDATEIETLS